MKNCLITSFKGQATGELPYYGAIHFSMRKMGVTEPTKEQLYLNIGHAKDSKFIISGDGHFTDETLTENLGKEITITGGYEKVYFSLGDYEMYLIARYSDKISIDNKEVASENNLITLHIDDLKFINNIHLQVRSNIGNIESLMNKTNMTYIDVCGEASMDDRLYGDFSKLGTVKTAGENCYFIIKNGNIHGEILDFIDNYISAKNTNSFYIWISDTHITYNGIEDSNMRQFYISSITETSFQITYGSTTDTWNKNSDKWVLQR